jgi:uncharacterized membrane protein YciS (DUF1049 family)
MIKKILNYTLKGIANGCLWLVFYGILFYVLPNREPFENLMNHYPIQAAGSILVGIAFVLPAIVYDCEKLSFPIKIIIHMGTGLTVFFITAFYLGWIPRGAGVYNTLLFVLGGIIIGFIIWFGFYLYYKRESRRINKKIQDLEDDNCEN